MRPCRMACGRAVSVLKHELCDPCAGMMRSWKRRPAADKARRMTQLLLAQRRMDNLDTIVITPRKFRDGKVVPFRKKRTTLPRSAFKRNKGK